MAEEDRRRVKRNESLNLFDYEVLGEDLAPITRGVGRTLNLSSSGALLQTHLPFPIGQLLHLTLELEDNLVEVGGQIIYHRPCAKDRFCCGVRFTGMGPEEKQIFQSFLRALKGKTDEGMGHTLH